MNRAGYTLAELMIALVLAALAIGIVTTGVQQSLAFERRIDAARQDRETVTSALAALRSRLEMAVTATAPADPESAPGANRRTPLQQPSPDRNLQEGEEQPDAQGPAERSGPVLFDGTASALVFLAADPGYPARPGLYEYRLAVVPQGEEAQEAGFALNLSRRALTELSAFGQGGEAQSWTLMETAEAVTLSYAGGSGGWRPAWQDQDALPVRVRLEFGEGSGEPPFIVSLPAMPPEADAAEDEPETAP